MARFNISQGKDGFWHGRDSETGLTLGFEDEAEAKAWKIASEAQVELDKPPAPEPVFEPMRLTSGYMQVLPVSTPARLTGEWKWPTPVNESLPGEYIKALDQMTEAERREHLDGQFPYPVGMEWRPHKIGFACVTDTLYSLCKVGHNKRQGDLYEVRWNGMLVALHALPLEEAKEAAERHRAKRGLTHATR